MRKPMGSRLQVVRFLVALPVVVLANNDKSRCLMEPGSFTSGFSSVWSFVHGLQPSHANAPFKGSLMTPIGLPGVCLEQQITSDDWVYDPSSLHEWIARPKVVVRVWALVRDGSCSPSLSALGVATSPSPELRLYFEGCSGLHVIVIVPLVIASAEVPVPGVALSEFMCHVGGVACGNSKLASYRDVSAKTVGPGRCGGKGVMALNNVTSVERMETCRERCNERRIEGEVPPLASCSSFAWSNNSKMCIIYGGSANTSEHSEAEGFTCYSFGELQTPQSEEQVSLDLGQIVRAGHGRQPFSAIRTIVQFPEKPRLKCFNDFQRIVLDEKPIHVNDEDWRRITTRSKEVGGVSALQEPASEQLPLADITVERVCVRLCDGELEGSCDTRDSPRDKAAFADALHVAGSSGIVDKDLHLDGRGDRGPLSFFDIVKDQLYLPWLFAVAVLFFLVGCGTAGWIFVRIRNEAASIPPNYFTVETVSLKYEADQESSARTLETEPPLAGRSVGG
eukprot:TRINITY_DN62563_c0_g1_i1.p1 TRINITY_DN62563_c0_g1~~TRINITY_DN62563_c0_g1_i1.p1  ORF type:complete len:507 (-),score=81.48 TRINITY_DN62563_c0_g1_i1:488-2008(-)